MGWIECCAPISVTLEAPGCGRMLLVFVSFFKCLVCERGLVVFLNRNYTRRTIFITLLLVLPGSSRLAEQEGEVSFFK